MYARSDLSPSSNNEMGSGFLNAIYRPALFIVTILALLFMMERASLQQSTHFRLSAVKGFFLQDEDSTDPSVFDYVCHSPFLH